jgi:hypothetical protein
MNHRALKPLIATFLGTILLLVGCGETSNSSGSGGSGGTGNNCQMVETSTSAGTWDITLEFAMGDPLELTELTAAQTGCTVTMSASDADCTLGITGPLSSAGVWNADLDINCTQGQYVADFTGTFSGGPPYDMLSITSGSDSDGDTISGGEGAITP